MTVPTESAPSTSASVQPRSTWKKRIDSGGSSDESATRWPNGTPSSRRSRASHSRRSRGTTRGPGSGASASRSATSWPSTRCTALATRSRRYRSLGVQRGGSSRLLRSRRGQQIVERVAAPGGRLGRRAARRRLVASRRRQAAIACRSPPASRERRRVVRAGRRRRSRPPSMRLAGSSDGPCRRAPRRVGARRRAARSSAAARGDRRSARWAPSRTASFVAEQLARRRARCAARRCPRAARRPRRRRARPGARRGRAPTSGASASACSPVTCDARGAERFLPPARQRGHDARLREREQPADLERGRVAEVLAAVGDDAPQLVGVVGERWPAVVGRSSARGRPATGSTARGTRPRRLAAPRQRARASTWPVSATSGSGRAGAGSGTAPGGARRPAVDRVAVRRLRRPDRGTWPSSRDVHVLGEILEVAALLARERPVREHREPQHRARRADHGEKSIDQPSSASFETWPWPPLGVRGGRRALAGARSAPRPSPIAGTGPRRRT